MTQREVGTEFESGKPKKKKEGKDSLVYTRGPQDHRPATKKLPSYKGYKVGGKNRKKRGDGCKGKTTEKIKAGMRTSHTGVIQTTSELTDKIQKKRAGDTRSVEER